MSLSLHSLAQALGGRVRGNKVVAPGPEAATHTTPWKRKRLTLAVWIRPDGEFRVHSHTGQDPIATKDWVRRKCGLPAWRPKKRKPKPLPSLVERGQYINESLRIARDRKRVTSEQFALIINDLKNACPDATLKTRAGLYAREFGFGPPELEAALKSAWRSYKAPERAAIFKITYDEYRRLGLRRSGCAEVDAVERRRRTKERYNAKRRAERVAKRVSRSVECRAPLCPTKTVGTVRVPSSEGVGKHLAIETEKVDSDSKEVIGERNENTRRKKIEIARGWRAESEVAPVELAISPEQAWGPALLPDQRGAVHPTGALDRHQSGAITDRDRGDRDRTSRRSSASGGDPAFTGAPATARWHLSNGGRTPRPWPPNRKQTAAASPPEPQVQPCNEIIEPSTGALKAATIFPPVVDLLDGDTSWLNDRGYRTAAHDVAGRVTIDVEQHPDDRRSAARSYVSTNTTPVLERSHEEKRRAVKRLLQEPPWSRSPDREAGPRCLSHTLVQKPREGGGKKAPMRGVAAGPIPPLEQPPWTPELSRQDQKEVLTPDDGRRTAGEGLAGRHAGRSLHAQARYNERRYLT